MAANIEKTIVGLDILGRYNIDGTLLMLKETDAIANSIGLFLTSKPGEFINRPTLGSPLYSLIFKPLKEENGFAMQEKTKTILQNQYTGLITVLNVIITPDLVKRCWEVSVEFSSLRTNEKQNAVFRLKSFEKKSPRIDYTVIPFTGDNLVNFIITMKPELQGESLIFLKDIRKYVWGQFKFQYLTKNSPEFPTIENLIFG